MPFDLKIEAASKVCGSLHRLQIGRLLLEGLIQCLIVFQGIKFTYFVNCKAHGTILNYYYTYIRSIEALKSVLESITQLKNKEFQRLTRWRFVTTDVVDLSYFFKILCYRYVAERFQSNDRSVQDLLSILLTLGLFWTFSLQIPRFGPVKITKMYRILKINHIHNGHFIRQVRYRIFPGDVKSELLIYLNLIYRVGTKCRLINHKYSIWS